MAPLSVRYFDPSGFFAVAGMQYIDQSVNHQSDNGHNDESWGNAWLLDASIGYRLPQRRGIISLDVNNILDQNFHWQNDTFRSSEQQNRLFLPERSAMVRLNLDFLTRKRIYWDALNRFRFSAHSAIRYLGFGFMAAILAAVGQSTAVLAADATSDAAPTLVVAALPSAPGLAPIVATPITPVQQRTCGCTPQGKQKILIIISGKEICTATTLPCTAP